LAGVNLHSLAPQPRLGSRALRTRWGRRALVAALASGLALLPGRAARAQRAPAVAAITASATVVRSYVQVAVRPAARGGPAAGGASAELGDGLELAVLGTSGAVVRLVRTVPPPVAGERPRRAEVTATVAYAGN
jgi:hypothetical protein